MNYKETLFFIAKCLTISHEKENKFAIEETLKSNTVNWENVVKISTAHYVFPALYCNLKRAKLLHYLPQDLVEYMLHITELNSERNQQIITQAKEINSLLLANNITPIFLKGTGNLLEGLYEDIAERMVGDIDFIVDEMYCKKAYEILKSNGYTSVNDEKTHIPMFKHLPRLKKETGIAAVEVHKELLLEKFATEFNYKTISKDFIENEDNINVMSFSNQLALSIIAKQINDNGIYFKNIALRNAYDVFLLSKKTNTIDTVTNFKKLFNPLNNFIAICAIVFENVTSLKFIENNETKNYVTAFLNTLSDSKNEQKNQKKITAILFLKGRLKVLKKAIFDKKMRQWLIHRLLDKNWQQQKLIQLGLKKPKQDV